MQVHHIPFHKTGYFSNLICDYLGRNEKLSDFYGNFTEIDGFRNQIDLKRSSFKGQSRELLVAALKNQSKSTNNSDLTLQNIDLLKNETTFTITTGHQLNLFTGPLYFLYKIVTAINLTEKLKKEFPKFNFVPVYWMATEDHDFDEINFFNYKGTKISWDIETSGGVGRLKTSNLDTVFKEFSGLIGDSENAQYLKDLFQKSYTSHSNLAEATRYLVNEIFGNYGLVIIDGDDVSLKQQFSSVVQDELLNNTSFKEISKTTALFSTDYNVQVNPREINLFYLKDAIRERIIFEKNEFIIKNTDIVFSQKEIIEELSKHPERFSPNVVMRPMYQEVILPNLCYIGGGGELAYWLQLKRYFDRMEVPYPILLLRSSVLFTTPKQVKKLEKLNVSMEEIFKDQSALINKKIREISEIEIDFSAQRKYLQDQFSELKELALQTEASFLGAVNAQEKKQLNGLDKLEKRLLRAQKRKLHDVVQRITLIQDQLFPNRSLEERTRNISEIYLELGDNLIPMLKEALDPLKLSFSIIETN
jgi:bacillithiol biosynthesis cysteine-adding enzyme BshC